MCVSLLLDVYIRDFPLNSHVHHPLLLGCWFWWLLGMFWWLLSLLGSLWRLLSVCGMTGNLSLVEFLGNAFLIIFFIWLSLHLGMGGFILDILHGLSMLTYSRVFIYQVVVQSMHFHFPYIKNTKILGILHCLEFWSFESLSLA